MSVRTGGEPQLFLVTLSRRRSWLIEATAETLMLKYAHIRREPSQCADAEHDSQCGENRSLSAGAPDFEMRAFIL